MDGSRRDEGDAGDDEMKPIPACPFCGNDDHEIRGHYYVSCRSCRATGPQASSIKGAYAEWEKAPRKERKANDETVPE